MSEGVEEDIIARTDAMELADDDAPHHHNDDHQDEMFTLRRGASQNAKAMDAVVGILDNSEVTVFCEQGRHITAGELRDKVAEAIGLDENHKDLFAIWVISELQLKLYHTPFKVLKKWSEMVLSFSSEDPFSEVPALFFKRDAMVHQGVERKIKDPLALKLLFHEMTFNVVHSIYPCTLDRAATLAAIHLHIACGSTASKADVADIDGCQIPPHLKGDISSKKCAKKVIEQLDILTIPSSNVDSLVQHYLQYGWEWPYYGAVFFQGEIEYPDDKTIWRETPNEIVRIGINLEGVHIINDKPNTIKLSLPYDKLRYNSFEDPRDGDSCFIVEFDLTDAPSLIPKKSKKSPAAEYAKQTLTIWTRQASMADALASRYIEELDKWQDYLSEKARERGAQEEARKKAGGRVVERGSGLTATISRFIGKGDANPRAGFTLSKFRFLSKRSLPVIAHGGVVANRTTIPDNDDAPPRVVVHEL